MHSNEEVIKKLYDGLKAGNFNEMKTCYESKVKFSDVAFNLKGIDDVCAMWEMLCTREDEIGVSVSNIKADEKTGTADWVADYLYPDRSEKPDKQSRIVNKIKATFIFNDGKIIEHHDTCDTVKLAEMVLGPKGKIIGRIPFIFPFLLSKKLNKMLETFKMQKAKEAKFTMTAESFELGKEYPPADEDFLIQEIFDLSKASMGDKLPKSKLRDQHPKSHGYVEGSFEILEKIADDYRVGIFAEPKASYKIWVRFSNGSNRGLPDYEGDIRGMAIKLMDVKGEMVSPKSPPQQDFILINNPTFFLKDIQGYKHLPQVLAALNKGEITKDAMGNTVVPPDLLPDFNAISYALPILSSIREKQTPSPLEIPYWSATPYKLGNRAMKFSVVPHTKRESFDPKSVSGRNDYLREEMTKLLDVTNGQDACFDFMIQLQTDAEKMPIEDPTVNWDSEPVKVATIRISKQDFNTSERKQEDDKQSFSPWNSLELHRPLGGVNRARKIYADLAKIRNEKT
jgi:Catalase/SnoaL-like domain